MNTNQLRGIRVQDIVFLFVIVTIILDKIGGIFVLFGDLVLYSFYGVILVITFLVVKFYTLKFIAWGRSTRVYRAFRNPVFIPHTPGV